MNTLKPPEIVSSDFDRIALLPPDKWNHNSHYHQWISEQLPENWTRLIEVGCGTGELCRLLAAPAREIEGVDLSRNMIIRARQLSKDYPDIKYRLTDFMARPYPKNTYDCIISIATVHHLPFSEFLEKAASMLKPGGRLLIIDLYKSARFSDYLFKTLAAPVSLLFRVFANGQIFRNRSQREAWKTHGEGDIIMKIAEMEELANQIIPGNRITRKLFFRYSLIWDKPKNE